MLLSINWGDSNFALASIFPLAGVPAGVVGDMACVALADIAAEACVGVGTDVGVSGGLSVGAGVAAGAGLVGGIVIAGGSTVGRGAGADPQLVSKPTTTPSMIACRGIRLNLLISRFITRMAPLYQRHANESRCLVVQLNDG